MKYFDKKCLTKDILAGIIVALVSIPISMGYSQIAGLPPVYGLYGSLFPILIFAFVTSSRQFVFGVDATPAVLVGGSLATMGIATGSDEAIALVPVITLVVALWLFIFFLIRAGKLVKYISKSVMGGFITGIGVTIIMMQIPKLFGGSAGTGEVFVLIVHIIKEFKEFSVLSAILGFGTVAVLLIVKKIAPKFPMSVVMMVVGALLTAVFHIDNYGVKLLPKVSGGLISPKIPDVKLLMTDPKEIIVVSFTIALVIVAQTLLATCNYANKYEDKLDNNREVLAYSLGNAMGALFGCCPINGSVSRTGMADQYGAKSQMMSVSAAVTMLIVILFGTGLLQYMPVPILTGIVVVALIGILEFGMSKKLWKTNKSEFFIFMAAFAGVLVFGTIYGVIIGVILSFIAVIIRAVDPPKTFLGMIPGHEGLYNLQRNRNAIAIKNTVIYRFSGNLFFANVDSFENDIESEIKDDTKIVIVDARGIGSIDMTAAERLLAIYNKLSKRGIHFYITEHVGSVNDQLRAYGADELIEKGAVRRTVTLALRASGMHSPYILEGDISSDSTVTSYAAFEDERFAEFEWAFGDMAEDRLERFANDVAHQIVDSGDFSIENIIDKEEHISFGRVGLFDEDELLNHLELRLLEMKQTEHSAHFNAKEIEEKIEQRRAIIEAKLQKLNPEAHALLKRHRAEVAEHIKARKRR